MQNTTLTLYRAGILAGLSLLLTLSLMLAILPTRVAWMPDGLFTPILGFEFLESEAERAALLGLTDQATITNGFSAEDIAQSLWLGVAVDMAFLLSYGSFLAVIALTAWREQQRRIYLLAAAMAILAAGSDAMENRLLLALAQPVLQPLPDSAFDALRFWVLSKFSGLAMCALLLVPFIGTRTRSGKVFAAAAGLNLVAVLLTFLSRSWWPELSMPLTSIIWTLLFVRCLQVIRHSRSVLP
jgi:hypothetical protein